MCHSELQRISELRDYSIGLRSPAAIFQQDSLSDPVRREGFSHIERDLQGLDIEAWTFLKNEALPRLKAKHPTRGLLPLFDTLNEAKGYNHLVQIGCTNIKFIPRSITNNIQTPDLQGILACATVLCEVKTINKSDIELDRIKNGDVGTSPEHLGEGFFNKLLYDVKTASSQMLAFSGDTGIRRIAFIVVNFDEGVEWADEYWSQIEAYMANASMLGVEAVLVDQFGTRLLRRQWPRGGRA